MKLYELSTSVTKLGFCATFIINKIFINLTLSYTEYITKNYKRMLVIFASICIVFSLLEVISQPYCHNFNESVVYFSLADSEVLSHTLITFILLIYASCYVAQLGFIAIQFLFRYFTLIQHPFRKTFYGKIQVIWILYFFVVAAVYGLTAYQCLQPDDYSDAYLEREMLKVYRKRISDLPRFNVVPFENGRLRWNIVPFCAIGLIVIGFQYFIILFCALKMKSHMKANFSNFSTRNRKLEIQFLKALRIQVTLPTLLIFVPIGFVLITPLLKLEISCQTGIIFLLCSVYPSLDSIATMVIVKEYRKCVRCFWNDLKKVFCSSEKLSNEPVIELQLAQVSSIVNLTHFILLLLFCTE